MKPLFLQIPLTDVIKLPPYSKYMKDIISNKRKIPNEEISTRSEERRVGKECRL